MPDPKLATQSKANASGGLSPANTSPIPFSLISL
jgi:hypothetical protein